MHAVGGAAALALENERLTADLRATVSELRASRARIVESADNARRQIERDLHDGAQQRLVALALTLRMARARRSTDDDARPSCSTRPPQNLDEAIRELRELARGIHPAVLSDRGLGSALEALARRMPLPIEIGAVPDERLPERVEAAAYFVVAEAITNVARYASASHARVDLACDDGHLVVEVADDGIGGAEPVQRLRPARAERPDRSASTGGSRSPRRPGEGTTVRALLPGLGSGLSAAAVSSPLTGSW